MDSSRATEVYEVVGQGMAPADIQFWLSSIAEHSLRHIRDCSANPTNINTVDEGMLAYEEAFLFLYGLALKNKWLAGSIEERAH